MTRVVAMGDDGDWMRRLGRAPEDTRSARGAWERRRRANMRLGETLAAARKRWRSEGHCRDCGQPLIEDGREGGARCGSCRAGAEANGGRGMSSETKPAKPKRQASTFTPPISQVSLLNG